MKQFLPGLTLQRNSVVREMQRNAMKCLSSIMTVVTARREGLCNHCYIDSAGQKLENISV